jgi:hypothetical protein
MEEPGPTIPTALVRFSKQICEHLLNMFDGMVSQNLPAFFDFFERYEDLQ